MTIKTECVIKHLKHDYKDLLMFVGIFVGVVIIGITLVAICQYSYITAKSIAVTFTAYNVFITLAIITAAFVTIGLAIFGTPNTFKYTAPKEGTAITENITEEHTSSVWIFVSIALGAVWFFYGFYNFDGFMRSTIYPDMIITTLIISIYIIVVTPICGAIARCKE